MPANAVRYSSLPVPIGDGTACFERLDGDVAPHLLEAKGEQRGMVTLRYEVNGPAAASGRIDRSSAG